MLQLQTATGELFDLYDDTSIELEFVNPAFAPAGEDGSFGYPFDLPGTARNHRLTSFAYQLQKRDVLGISIDAKLHAAGLPIADGVLKLTFPVSRQRIRVFLVVNQFADAIKGKRLRKVAYATPPRASIVGSAVTDFMDARVTPLSDDFAFYPSLGFHHQNPYYNGFTALIQEVVPHPYVRSVYRYVCESNGYQFRDGFYNTAADLRQLTLHHHRTATFDADTNELVFGLADMVPDIEIGSFIKQLDAFFNTKTFVDVRRKELYVVNLATLLDAPYLNWEDRADDDYDIEPTEYNGYTLSFEWPDIDTFHEEMFTDGFRRAVYLSSWYFWDNNETVDSVAELSDIDGTLPSSGHVRTIWVREAKAFYFWNTGTWARLQYKFQAGDGDPFALPSPVENSVYFDNDTQQWWIWIKKDFSTGAKGWIAFSYAKSEDLEIGERETPIKSTVTPVELWYYIQPGLPPYVPLPCSRAQVEGLSSDDGPNREEAQEDESLRLLIYRSLDQTVHPGYRYPFATPDEYDTRGVLVGTHSLRWDGARGLYENFWKRWLEFLESTRLVTRELRLSASDIYNLDLTKQVRVGGVNHLIGKLNVAISMRGISPAKCELYTVGSGSENVTGSTSGTAPAGGIGVMEVESTNKVG